MRKSILQVLTSLALLLPAVACADEYVLVMSKEDNLCQYMLGLYNDDLRKYGEVRYDEHDEFNWIKWEEKLIRLRPPSYPQNVEKIEARMALFDVNNDSNDEVVIYRESMLSSQLMDVYDIFRHEDLEILNEIIDGSKYYEKTLKSFDSASGIPVYDYDLSEEDIKKLPERKKYYIAKAKERGDNYLWLSPGKKESEDKYLFFVSNDKIKSLKHNNHFHIYSEETKDHSYHGDAGQYSIISELQNDNTLKNQCLYLIKKDKQSKGRK